MPTVVHFIKKNKLSKPVLFTGLPGIGLVGKIALDYLHKQLNSEKVADIYSDSFPPAVHSEQGVLGMIANELYRVRYKGRDFLFLVGPVQPSLDLRVGSSQEHYEFAVAVVEAVRKVGVKEIYTLAGINVGEKRMKGKPKVIAAATDDKTLKEFKKIGCKISPDGGLISGAAGLVLGIAKQKGMRGACLMGETNARLVYGDHGAAQRLLELLIKKYGFKLDLRDMKKEAKHVEDAFKQLSKQLEARRASEEEDNDNDSPTYVR